MKIERLYAITIYLLNHGRTPASELAEHFEVSLRTIQRDMESLCLSGIPVISAAGATGGYEIAERFRLDHQFATSDDYACILTALQGLVSATGGQKARHTLEKIASVSKPADNCLLLDFSVLREGDTAALQALQSAIAGKRMVSFTYTNNNNETRTHSVEPVAVLYRWYAWYLLAYSRVKGDYRTYKLVRMSSLEITDTPFTKEHEPAALILQKNDAADSRIYLDVLVKCRPAAVSRIKEYLNGTILRENPEDPSDGSILMELTVVENEQLWLGTLLSLGDNVEVLAPEKVRRQLLEAAEKSFPCTGKPADRQLKWLSTKCRHVPVRLIAHSSRNLTLLQVSIGFQIPQYLFSQICGITDTQIFGNLRNLVHPYLQAKAWR